jgi:hypothetical protein
MSNQFTYAVIDNTIRFNIDEMYEGDLSRPGDDWMYWGDYSDWENHQQQVVEDFVKKHFGHIYSDENKMLAKLAGWNIECEDAEINWDNNEIVVDITVEPTDWDSKPEDWALADETALIDSIVDGVNIDEDDKHLFQQDQFDWWNDNGCSPEDNNMAWLSIERGKVILVENCWKPIKDATQAEMDAWIEYVNNDQCGENFIAQDSHAYDYTKQAVEEAGFVFKLQPKFELEEA